MSQPCAITTCKHSSRAPCDCCQQNLCLQHLKEHNDALVAQLNPLIEEINALGSRLSAVNVAKITGNSRQKLEQWRVDCHKTIDRFFEKKCQEFDGLVTKKMNKQRDEIDRLRSKISKLVDEQETTRQEVEQMASSIEGIKREMNNIERASVQVDVRPLIVEDGLIHIEEQLNTSTLPPACKTIEYSSKSYVSLASNDRFLLIHQAPNLCLIDRELRIAKKTAWNHGDIRDMCWSSTLGWFIVLTPDDVYLVNENTMSIEHVKMIPREEWFCCTCPDNSLFLSTNRQGPWIVEFSLLPSIQLQLVNQWHPPRTCREDESIGTMVYIKQKLALIVGNDSKKTIHIELRSSLTLDRLWSLRLDIVYNKDIRVTCCFFKYDEWLVVDRHASRVLQITRNGEMRATCAYNPAPFRASLFGTNILAISTDRGINFHKV